MSSAEDGRFPRLGDLMAGIAPLKQRKAWQRELEKIVLEDGPRWGRVEATLARLPVAAWQRLKAVILGQVDLRNPAQGWVQAMPLLNEARAHDHLVRHGFHDVDFLVAQAHAKSPDLRALRDGRVMLCEVKTVRLGRGDGLAGTLDVKLAQRLRDAAQQLGAISDPPDAARMIYLVLDISDDLQPMAGEIRQQVDRFLAQVELAGVDVVVDDNAPA
ncbi:hypothetical protein [Dongia mobilis]|uniref:hypothetical protein n=1 Tax=Dongia sp. TaxID=1977262 RepID=UPI0026F21DC0